MSDMHKACCIADDDGSDDSHQKEETSGGEPFDCNRQRKNDTARSEASHLGMATKSRNKLSLADQEELALKLLSRKHN